MNNQQKLNFHQQIGDYARQLGFDLVGFSPAKIEEKYLKIFEEWLKNGNAADMDYMWKIKQRRDMHKVLPGAKSVIVLGMNYYHEQPPLKRGHGRIARYAYGRDYHKVIGKKLKELEKFIHEICNSINLQKSARADFLLQTTAKKNRFNSTLPSKNGSPPLVKHSIDTNSSTKSYVDTGPVMERALAEQAGLGRIGKNGCLITEKFGSWIFISEIITTLDLNFTTSFPGMDPQSVKSSLGRISNLQKVSPVKLFTNKNDSSNPASRNSVKADSPCWSQATPSRWSSPSEKPFNVCGNCTRCITSCPTGAIIAPGIIDSNLCISYLTIENRKKIPPRLAKIIKKTKRLFGCDICQEICPHNQARLRASKAKELFNPKIAGNSLELQSLPHTDAKFLKTFASSPLMRAKRKGLLRNTKIIVT